MNRVDPIVNVHDVAHWREGYRRVEVRCLVSAPGGTAEAMTCPERLL